MSVFAKLRSAVLPIPNANGATATIRGLSPTGLRAASAENQRKAVAAMRAQRELAAGVDEAEADTPVDPEAVKAWQEQVRRNPLLSYDAETLIVKGVSAWTLELEPTPENVAELDEDTRDWLATEILKLSKPSLFKTEAEQEAEQKEL